MHRLFALMAVIAGALGVWLLFSGPSASPPAGAGLSALLEAPLAYGGWAIGLLMGLFLAWLAAIDWRGLPDRLMEWTRLQRRRFGWALLGGVFAAILLFY